jgi:hypothetical protein
MNEAFIQAPSRIENGNGSKIGPISRTRRKYTIFQILDIENDSASCTLPGEDGWMTGPRTPAKFDAYF